MHLRLPATSANLGPGFDAVGLAMSLYLEVEAEEAGAMAIHATGRSADITANVDGSLIVSTYRDVLRVKGVSAPSLTLKLHNEIPLGMGCGSSAAALLAGVHLANHFGKLRWTAHEVMAEACRREGHPDNVAACALGGLTVARQHGPQVVTASLGRELGWRLLLALPSDSLATEKARALLPAMYTRADTVANIQCAALLVAAFALNRPELLVHAMADRVHHPYRTVCCPLLARLLPLSGTAPGIYGVALSGAGPSVLLILDAKANQASVEEAVRQAAGDPLLELVTAEIANGAVCTSARG